MTGHRFSPRPTVSAESDTLFPFPDAPLSEAEARGYGDLDALQELVENDGLTKDELRAAAWVLIDRVQGLRADVRRIEDSRSAWARALGEIVAYRPCLRFDVTPCSEREQAESEWCPLCRHRTAAPS